MKSYKPSIINFIKNKKTIVCFLIILFLLIINSPPSKSIIKTQEPQQQNIIPTQQSIIISNQKTENLLLANTKQQTAEDEIPTKIPAQETKSDLYLVTQVIDGDTIEVEINGLKEKLRLIGINTPETVDPRKPFECFGKESSDEAKKLLIGKKVRLEYDSTQSVRDKYNRLLAYVYLEDGLFYNKQMIERGFAYEYTYNIPYKYQTDFKKAETFAKNNKLGLWADDACK